MRKIVIGLMSTLSGLVLLFSYHTSTNSGTAVASGGTGGSGTGSSGSTGSTGSGGSTGTGSSGGATSGTFTGDAVDTRWGVVQVEITVENGRITKAEAIQYPTENHRDQEINAYAVPALNDEAVQAQSANIDAISGATVTSGGYIQSLQSAVDQAHL